MTGLYFKPDASDISGKVSFEKTCKKLGLRASSRVPNPAA